MSRGPQPDPREIATDGCRQCGREKLFTRGLCQPCYRAYRLSPEFTPRRRHKPLPADLIAQQDFERFISKIEVTETCWLYRGTLTRDGYGRFRVRTPWTWSAHRYSYTRLVGPIPDELTVDHICWVRNCVNPDHLQLLTLLENAGRQRLAVLGLCEQGHKIEGDNAYTWRGRNYCRTCRRRQDVAYRARRAAEAAA